MALSIALGLGTRTETLHRQCVRLSAGGFFSPSSSSRNSDGHSDGVETQSEQSASSGCSEGLTTDEPRACASDGSSYRGPVTRTLTPRQGAKGRNPLTRLDQGARTRTQLASSTHLRPTNRPVVRPGLGTFRSVPGPRRPSIDARRRNVAGARARTPGRVLPRNIDWKTPVAVTNSAVDQQEQQP